MRGISCIKRHTALVDFFRLKSFLSGRWQQLLCCLEACIHEEHLLTDNAHGDFSKGLWIINKLSISIPLSEYYTTFSYCQNTCFTIELFVGLFHNSIVWSFYLPVAIFDPWLAVRHLWQLAIFIHTSCNIQDDYKTLQLSLTTSLQLCLE